MTEKKTPKAEVISDVPSNPAEQNPKVVVEEEQKKFADAVSAFNENKKPPRSDSSSDTFVADAAEGLKHEQAQRSQEAGGDSLGTDKIIDVNPEMRNERDGTQARNFVSPENAALLTSVSPTQEATPEGRIVDEFGRTRRYVNGRPVAMHDADWDKYVALINEVNELQRDRAINDIPITHDEDEEPDPFWVKRRELDKFASQFS